MHFFVMKIIKIDCGQLSTIITMAIAGKGTPTLSHALALLPTVFPLLHPIREEEFLLGMVQAQAIKCYPQLRASSLHWKVTRVWILPCSASSTPALVQKVGRSWPEVAAVSEIWKEGAESPSKSSRPEFFILTLTRVSDLVINLRME